MAALFLAALVLIHIPSCGVCAPVPNPASGTAQVEPLTGNLALSIEGGALTSNGHPVKAGYFIPYGATLRLTSEGKAVVRFGGEGALLLKGPAVLRLTRGRHPGAELTQGGLLGVLPRLRNPFYVQTRSVLVAIHGGVSAAHEFYMEARGRDETYFCMCSGEAEVSQAREGRFKAALSSTRHKSYDFRLSQSVLLQSEVPAEHHTDAEIEMLRSTVKAH